MQSWRIDLAWDGTNYCGWQRQPQGRSIQEEVEKALTKLFGGELIAVRAAGRTDAGVHAMQQIASFDAESPRDEHKVQQGLSALLPDDIVCLCAKKMPEGFQARWASKRKLYRYRVLSRHVRDPLRMGRVWWIKDDIQCSVLQSEAQFFIGTHDFTSFRAARCTAKSVIRTIESFTVHCDGDELVFEVIGKGFLRHQVRIMVGTLIDIARGNLKNIGIRQILRKCDRRKAGLTAPAHGLYLVWTELKELEKDEFLACGLDNEEGAG